MNIDNRIELIMKKMDRLKEKSPKFACGKFPPEWKPPLSEQVIETYEKQNGIQLPEDYRRFVTTVAECGTQPFYGLYSLKSSFDEDSPTVNEKFPFTVRNPFNVSELSAEEYKAFWEDELSKVDAGLLLLCTEGDAMYSILIVNTDDKETYGTVWYYDLANDFGIYPLINPQNGIPMRFLDWLEYYADKTYELSDEEYFGYAELAGKVE